MSSSKSFFLNFIRWVSALLVVLGHTKMVNDYYFKTTSFNKSYSFFCYFDHSSVVVFFVLSGYLIFHTSHKYEKENINSLRKYFIDRFSRIYSVLVPALLLTAFLDAIGKIWFKEIYLANVPTDHYFFRFIWNLLSLQGTWGPRVQFASDPALWSVGYEFSFYLLFSVYIFKKELFWKNKGCLLFILIFFLLKGPKISIYFFVWLFGCLAYILNKKYNLKIKPVLFIFLLFLFFVAKIFVYQSDTILRNNEYIQDYIYGFLFAILLIVDIQLPAATNPSGLLLRCKGFILKTNDFLAGISFTLYAIHLPILYISYAVLYAYFPDLYNKSPELISVLFVIISVISAYCFSFISEKKNIPLKSFLSNYFISKIKKIPQPVIVKK